MTVYDLLLVLRARWRVMALITLATLAVVAGVNLALPKQYRASTTVIVDVKGADPVAGNNNTAVQAPQPVPSYLATQVGVVTSDRVVEKVIQSLGLEQDAALRERWQADKGWWASIADSLSALLPGESEPQARDGAASGDPYKQWLAARLLKNLDVRPAHEGSLIDISVRWEDPARAARIANAFALAYINTNLELKVEPAKHYVAWFEERNQAVRKNLEQAQARLSQYQRDKGIVAAPEARLDIENARLADLSSQLTALQGTRADSASRASEAGRQRDNIADVLQSPVIVNLKAELSKLESQRAELSKRYGANYPDMRRVIEQIAALNERVTQETGRITESLNTTNKINLQREAEIRGAMDTQRARVLELSRQHDQIAVLQYDVSNAQKMYDTVTQRLAQTSLESQNQMTNATVITPAVQPMSPDSPRIKVNLAMALVFGALLGMGLALLREKLDQRLYGPDQLRQVLGAPVFGVLEQAGKTLRLGASRRLALRP